MTLREYIKKLQKVDPKYLDLPIIYASDDEGNSFHPVYNDPTLVEVDDPSAHYVEIVWDEETNLEGQNFNAIIIN